jgi:hypothetical protein
MSVSQDQLAEQLPKTLVSVTKLFLAFESPYFTINWPVEKLLLP